MDFIHPSGDGEPPWSNVPTERFAFDPNFDEFGDYTDRSIQTLNILDESSQPMTVFQPSGPTNMLLGPTKMLLAIIHLAMKNSSLILDRSMLILFRKLLNSLPNGKSPFPILYPMRKHLNSRNPALNIPRRHEPVATDTVFSDTPAVDSGVKQAQVVDGRDTLDADAYPKKSGKQFVNTLEENIRRRGAMDKLLSDSAKTEISNEVMDILRAHHISN